MAKRAPHGSKAGRNEGRKLFASFLNTLAAASTVAALVQPSIGIVREARPLSRAETSAAFIFVLIGVTLHAAAQIVVRRLED